MNKNEFLYRIIIGTTNYDLVQSPIGWEENIINFKRDTKYWGIIKDFTVPLEFVVDGATLLRTQYYQYGSEAFVRLAIFRLNRKTWEYEQFFIGELDFSKATDKIETFTVNVMQGGIAKLISAYDNVKYDIDIVGGVDIMLPGIGISEKANSIFNNGSTLGVTQWLPTTLVVNKLDSGFAMAQSTLQTLVLDKENWIFKSNTAPLQIRISGSLDIQRDGGISRVQLWSTIGTGIEFLIGDIFYKNGSFAEIVTFDFNITASIDQRFFIKADLQGSSFYALKVNDSTIDLSYSVITNPSPCKLVSPKYVLEQILQKMNNNTPVPVTSYMFDNTDAGRIYLTSGNGIRGIANSKIKASFSDFFQSYSSVLGCGISIRDEGVSFEKFSDFFRSIVVAATVTGVKNCEFSTAIEYLYSSLKVGYKNHDYEMVDGKDEFNTQQEWTFPITKTNKTLDLTSVFRADVRGIEEIRVKLFNEDSTLDNENDNDVFMIKLNESLTAVEGANAYDSVTGVNSPERMYNLDLSPKKNILRNSPLISSFLYFMDGYLIRFQSSDKNAELATTDLQGKYVKENEDIDISKLEGEVFIPIIATFTAKSPRNLQDMIVSTPYGAIQFEYLGNTYKGFILEVSSDVSKNSEQEFKVLLTSGNNLVKLIH